MTRPSNNTYDALLKSGRDLIYKKGVSGLSIREIAKKAKVNLGMFSYNFKNKEEFINIILNDINNEFMQKLDLNSTINKDAPLDSLKEILFKTGVFVRDNRHFFNVMSKDIATGEKTVMSFFKKNFGKHLTLVINTINTCKKQKLIKDLPVASLVIMLMTSVSFPIILLDLVPLVSLAGAYLKITSRTILSDKAIKDRIDGILEGLII